MPKIEVIKTINVIALALILIYLIFNIVWVGWLGFILLVIATFEIPLDNFIAKYWMKFAGVLGFINSRILLTLVYYVMLTPIAILFRVFNKNITDHFKTKKVSLETTNVTYNKEFFERVW